MRRVFAYVGIATCVLALASAGPLSDAVRASTVRWENMNGLTSLTDAVSAFGRDLLAATARREGVPKSKAQTLKEAVEENDWKNDLVLSWLLPSHLRAQIPRTVQVRRSVLGRAGGDGAGVAVATCDAAPASRLQHLLEICCCSYMQQQPAQLHAAVGHRQR